MSEYTESSVPEQQGKTFFITGGSSAGSYEDTGEGISFLSGMTLGGDLGATNDGEVMVSNAWIRGDVFVDMYSHITLHNVRLDGDIHIPEDCGSCSVTVTPEPSSALMLAIGLAGIAHARRSGFGVA